jgi:NAD+ kinase
LDSRIETVDSNIQMSVKKADFTIKILRIETDDFMTTLRNKMMWGIDKRN